MLRHPHFMQSSSAILYDTGRYPLWFRIPVLLFGLFALWWAVAIAAYGLSGVSLGFSLPALMARSCLAHSAVSPLRRS